MRIFTSSKCLIAPYMGSSVQPNGLIDLPQVWGDVFSPMESSLQGKRKGPYGPFFIILTVHFRGDASNINKKGQKTLPILIILIHRIWVFFFSHHPHLIFLLLAPNIIRDEELDNKMNLHQYSVFQL